MSKGDIDRRKFLGLAAAGTAGLVLGGCSTAASRRPGTSLAGSTLTTTRPAGSDIGAVDHVVLVMQENRSFDHYFGALAGVRGFNDHPKNDLGVFAQAWPANTTKAPKGRLLPFHLDTALTDAECTFDLSHAWTAQHECWNHGAMDSFVRTHTSAEYEGPVNGVLTMGYYTRDDLPFYYSLAEAFTICDGYHCSVLGPTDPNRVMWWSGTIDPTGSAGGPVVETSVSETDKWTLSWRTMPEVLSDAGVTWKVYNPPGAAYVPTASLAMLFSNNRLMYFDQYKDPSSVLFKKAFLSTFPNDFAHDVATDSLPAVSWIVAPTFPDDMSEHPPAPPARGEYFVHQLLQVLSSNKKLWGKTVVFFSYDENDGFFDHVAPPTAPAGTEGEYLTGNLPSEAGGIAGPVGLGMRVPMLVLSPFARGGHVFSEVADHTSQLAFVAERFGVEVPNVSSWRRSVTSDLTRSLLPDAVGGLPPLPSTSLDAAVVEGECSKSEMIELENPHQPDLTPHTQSMPVQGS